jgi:sulfur-carrier protein adenylyltransferase/sulfurtransferase
MTDSADFISMTTEQLEQYIADHHVSKYLIIDVREPFEYAVGHIPGATFMPLTEVETKLFDLPEDKDLIFYCHSGGRSMAAAMLAAEAEVTQESVRNLIGGMVAWEGKRLEGFPKVHVFGDDAGPEDFLYTAMDLEKGAWRFYKYAFNLDLPLAVSKTFETLSKAETGHAKMIHGFWKTYQTDVPLFDLVFDNLKGDIIEGGEHLEQVLSQLENMPGSLCMNLVEIALHIEYSAFDLYRTMAEKATDSKAQDTFLTIAQAEKAHMKLLIKTVGECQA